MRTLSDPHFLTTEQYLEGEIKSPIKHEYINCEILTIAGTTDTPRTIAGNLFALIRNHLRGTDCRLYIADVTAYLQQGNYFYYPDFLLSCDLKDRENYTYQRFPKLMIEVLFPSSEAFERGDKFNDHQTLDSRQEYVLVNIKHQRFELFGKIEEGGWLFLPYTLTEEIFILKNLKLTVSWAEVYENVTLELASKTRPEN
ncbi:Uma2 family endonuclease [Laspinema olomoucense]|uniref:Uma2 family endonuclease n=1 Tax=Laspinema olomoucense D3b TaxID=2953688 RepID=A0ABT2N460_9CYAN|nr:Uma2 family endonuclease [Laspinema sp. D3b]MCT7977469.1 Uma2 family endonuclease [Laspinema sp. D3b]